MRYREVARKVVAALAGTGAGDFPNVVVDDD
jgi:hypothetical protein